MIKCAKAIDEFLILKENSCSVFTANSCCEQNKKFFFSVISVQQLKGKILISLSYFIRV